MQKEVQSPTDQQVGMMAIQQKVKVDDANLAIKERDSETKFLEVMSKIRNADVEAELRFAEVDAENERTAVESAIKIGDHINNTLETHHTIRNSNNGNDTER
jgi:hypothetical protein